MKCFISVNYGTSALINEWVENIKNFEPSALILIVDNFKSKEERERVQLLSSKLGFILLESDNIGYGRALNLAIRYCGSLASDSEKIYFAGNLDIKYMSVPAVFPSGKFIYQAKALEGDRDRNPFLTRLQKKGLFLHVLTLKTNSPIVLIFVTSILKLLGMVKSKVWTVHGSLFCFNEKCLSDMKVFNENSFLYSEELEFGSYMELHHCEFIKVDLSYRHDAHVATGALINSKRKFIQVWRPSFINWMVRWS